jgi:hypothetical protein
MNKVSLAIIAFTLISASSNAGEPQTTPSFESFDRIITPELIANHCTGICKFDLKIHNLDKPKARLYFSLFDLDTTDREVFYRCTITVTTAGDLLDPQKYQESKRVAEAEGILKDYFLPIGIRAIWEPSFGPGGGGASITFTTQDSMYDIKVSILNNLRKGMNRPEINLRHLTESISAAYKN